MLTTSRTAIAALTLTAGIVAPAQADIFQRALGNDEHEHAYHIEQTSDGGYITTGFRDTAPPGAVDEGVLITKHFADGTVEWQRLWNGPGRDIGYSVQEAVGGGYIVAAASTSSGAPGVEILLLRLDAGGSFVWANFYLGSWMADPIHDVHPGVALDQGLNGQVYVTGSFVGQPQLLAVDPSGALISNTVYGDPVSATRFGFTDIKRDPTNGTLVISGTTTRFEPPGSSAETQDPFLLRVDTAGNPIWIWNYDFPDLDPTNEPFLNSRETGDGLDITNLGEIVINGRTDFGGPAAGEAPAGLLQDRAEAPPPSAGHEGRSTTHLVVVDPSGSPVWGREYTYAAPDGTANPAVTAYAAVRWDDDDNIVQAGYIRTAVGTTSAVEWLTDPVGAPVWFWEYGGPNNTRGESVVQAADCGYAVAGSLEFLPALFPFDRGETYLAKNNDDGETGCLEQSWSFFPDLAPQVKQNAIIPNAISAILPAPNVLTPEIPFDEELCHDPDCDICPCDINGDGVLDLTDLSDFVTCFTNNLPCGDLAPPYGVWNLADISAFINCFLSGC